MVKGKIENAKFKENNTMVSIPNSENQFLDVPLKYFDFYVNCPDKLFSKITKVIEEKRELIIGLNKEDAKEEHDLIDVKVTISQKYIFTEKQLDNDEILFPELKHNDYVELEGHVTRGNENSNTIGFLYKEHIVTCYPIQGNINKYKSLLFTNCIIKGYVDRLDKEGEFNDKRPRIKFLDLQSHIKPGGTIKLF